MSASDNNQDPQKPYFTATSWTIVATAQDQTSPDAQLALEHLCKRYWYPLYAYVRRRGYSTYDAEDLTQGFFHRLLKENYLGIADREKGKFRTFLLCSLTHYLSNERTKASAKKRGGDVTTLSFEDETAEERYIKDTVSDPSATKVFEHGWATTLVGQVRDQLQKEYAEANKSELFHALKNLLEETSGTGDYPQIAKGLGMSTGSIAVAVHRLRQRYGKLLSGAVAETLADPTPAAVKEELRHLMSALSRN